MNQKNKNNNMKIFFQHKALIIATLVLLIATSCQKEYFPQPPAPKVAKETTTLEATFAITPPLSLNDPFWKAADFLKVPVIDLNKNMLYGDGLLNMTGTYNGYLSFNGGTDPKVVMKAAYDATKLYIYLEWIDSDISPAFEASFLNGPLDPLKSDTSGGWTSQGNSDKVSLAFEIANASSAAGTFSDKGCAASCHQNKMQPATGSVDIWNWDLAISEPLGYAKDMVTDGVNGFVNDAGTPMAVKNKTSANNPRSGPAYEWNGVEQTHIRPDGKSTNLDPAFFLLNKTAFLGDIIKGEKVYHNATYGCGHCHGEKGEGDGPTGEGTAFASTGFAGKYSRAMINTYSGNSDLHTGYSYWAQVPAADYDDLIAYIKGFGSIPGYYLTTPTGSNANVWSVSNVGRTKVNTAAPHTLYKVLLVRDLATGNSDDAQFLLPKGKSFPFGLALMDNDGKNHIGSLKQILTFK